MAILRLITLSLTIALATACGGGGGSVGGGGNSESGNSWLSITPSPVVVSTIDGKAAKFSITFTSSKPIAQILYPVFVDNQGVIDGTLDLFQSGLSYQASLMTIPTLTQGSHNGNFSLWLYTDGAHTAVYPGSPWLIPYQITVNPRYSAHKLIPEMVGIALSSTPGGSFLTRTLRISDNMGKSTPWTATSNQSWLSVTPAGTTGGATLLTLTADPASLPVDQTSFATISLTSSDTSLQTIEPIRIGLWKGSTSPQALSFGTNVSNVSNVYLTSFACADPIRPRAYLSYGTDTIDIFNPYTGTRVDTIHVNGSNLESIAIAQDGSTLYTVDSANSRILVFDLATLAQIASWTGVGTIDPIKGNPNFSCTRIFYFRPNGVGILMITNGTALLASSGAILSSSTSLTGPMTAPHDNRTIYTPNKYLLDYSDVGSGSLIVQQLNLCDVVPDSTNLQDVSVSGDGNRLYAAFGTPYKVIQFDPITNKFLRYLTGGAAFLSNVKADSDGRVYSVTGTGSINTSNQLLVNTANGDLISAQPISYLANGHTQYPSVRPGQLFVTPDARIAVINTGVSVHFLPTP